MKKEPTIQVRLPDELREEVRKEAERRGVSLSAWVRLIAREELDRRNKK